MLHWLGEGGGTRTRCLPPYDAGHREVADAYVWLRFVHHRDLAEEHANRVAQADPLERAQVCVQDKDCLHRFHLPRVTGDVERLAGFEPATFTMAR